MRHETWKLPYFTEQQMRQLSARFPDAVFSPVDGKEWRLELSHLFMTDNPNEYVSCPFLTDKGCGCTAEEKSFDCAVWPLRLCRRRDGSLHIMLTGCCPVVCDKPLEDVRQFVRQELQQRICAYAAEHPAVIRESLPCLIDVIQLEDAPDNLFSNDWKSF